MGTLRKFLAVAVLLAATLLMACGGKSAKLQSKAIPPDKTLFENGQEFYEKSQFIKARLAFQTLINTYPDSEYTPKAYLAVADSYYKEGGQSNLVQAEAQYKDFIVFYPTHEEVDDAQLKIASLHMRMMESPDRDPTHARRAEQELKKFLEQHSSSPLVPGARELLKGVQENLATGIYQVGKFYHDRKNYAAAEDRFREVVQRYPEFSGIDDIYYYLGDSIEKSSTERAPESVAWYQKAATHPEGAHYSDSVDKLQKLGASVPEPAPVQVAQSVAPADHTSFFLRPIKSVLEAVGITGGEDPYELARRTAEERAAADAVKVGTGTAGEAGKDDIQIETLLRKQAGSDKTTAAGPNPGGGSEDKNKTSADKKKRKENQKEKKGRRP